MEGQFKRKCKATLEARHIGAIGKFYPVTIEFSLVSNEALPRAPISSELKKAAIYAANIFGLKVNRVHAVWSESGNV